jgi:transposase
MPHSDERRVAQHNGLWSAYRCKACDRYHTILTGTVFEKTRQEASSKVVLILGGIAKGEPTARLARELGIGRPRMHEIRKQVQTNLYQTLPREPMTDEVLEADELYQNAGEKGEPHTDPDDPPRRRANKRPGHGTYETDRPPIFLVKGRQTGRVRCFVRKSSDAQNCLEVVAKSVGAGASVLNTDEWGGYVRVESRMGIAHRTECAMEATRTGAESGHATTMETVLGKSLHWQRLGGCSGAPLRTFS